MGQVSTHHRRLIDLLNSTRRSPFYAEDVRVRSQFGQHDYGTEVGPAYFKTDNILFAVPIEDETGYTPPEDRFLMVKKNPHPFRFAIGHYEIVGEIHLIEGGGANESLFGPFGKDKLFEVVTHAEIKRTGDNESVDLEDVIFVNKERIDYFVAHSN
jgi:hypothetical protein